ncbi:hypothetical protein Pmani_004106 [Petrolisthes manimaculis]|uniref:Uncharacterized protein n=1 Tax=Petrolisthes manimaculis TaxID=1843537 RepID=A0AAE1UHT4_9EUCA|nr:hypothetical protein Pmani_004106 [Petrolisthes manimaculis]
MLSLLALCNITDFIPNIFSRSLLLTSDLSAFPGRVVESVCGGETSREVEVDALVAYPLVVGRVVVFSSVVTHSFTHSGQSPLPHILSHQSYTSSAPTSTPPISPHFHIPSSLTLYAIEHIPD